MNTIWKKIPPPITDDKKKEETEESKDKKPKEKKKKKPKVRYFIIPSHLKKKCNLLSRHYLIIKVMIISFKKEDKTAEGTSDDEAKKNAKQGKQKPGKNKKDKKEKKDDKTVIEVIFRKFLYKLHLLLNFLAF